ncbi:HNH endonuclease signature motif containing protein [Frankia sp. Cj3]|uniref:HNH endonuclease signature motif containing protein n=1 Tax=Frankia sp. Cj3 TaxID=2880976 RepID=UPI001EF5E55E|nr:HNH endonuclease signature motif containing protein [Frankia sp. Cj3]
MFESSDGCADPGPAGPGPATALDLDGVDIEGLDASTCLTLMATITRQRAALDAVMLRTQGRFAHLRPETGPQRPFGEFAPDEVAAELNLSYNAAATQLALAHAVTHRLPATLAALAAGILDLGRVRAVADATEPLSDAHAAAVEARVLAHGGRASHAAFRQALRRAVLAIDPDGATQRHELQRRGRRVGLQPLEEGMAELSAFLAAPDAQAAYQRIDALARRAGDAQDVRSMDERRADVLTDILLGRHRDDDPVRVEVGVLIPLGTLAGLADTPGELAGYGPIPAGLARDLAANATWRRLLTDPVDGHVVDVGRRRFPSPALARQIRARDWVCRFPGCRTPATICDLDHVRAYTEGGSTEAANLLTLCRHHHRLKHDGTWTVEVTETGTATWTSPELRVYQTEPEPHPEPPPTPQPDPEPEPPPF